ncbi:MAG: sensor domain-containing diguanylate cyclase [Pseudomonadales bacterium]|nr:sensor domain-containing diguanylate cyclase [Pseudomonadales bacterium]NRA15074.1 sensor domain-containing diguanylate cyclase [Oceanospirillaceae bacterium]
MLKLKITKHAIPHILLGLLTFVLFLVGFELIISLLLANQHERKRSATVDKIATARAKIEGEFNSMLYLSAGLMAHVSAHPDIDENEFNQIAREIIATGRNIRNIGLAKDNVITHIYPLDGNEAALGLNYEEHEKQWPLVKRAIDLRGTVVAGPVDLAQGGNGFIVRTPIYIRTNIAGNFGVNKSTYWGLASIVIKTEGFFRSADFDELRQQTVFAIRGKDGLGKDGDIIMGNIELFSEEAIFSSVRLPNGTWQIAAMPLDGWKSNDGIFLLLHSFGLLTASLFGYLVTRLSLSKQLNHDLAFYDHLTNLPNRRLLDDRMLQVMAYSKRYNSAFGVFCLDLDDFKTVNDSLGHKAGDSLLIEASRRMLACVRATDTVARTGGDEFLILINDIHHKSDMQSVRRHLDDKFIGWVSIDGKRLQISASIGSATYPDDEESIDALLNKADKRMYAAKREKKAN